MRQGFAVLDFETTGLFPERHDRVIEIGLVLLSPDGSEEGRFETVVHPGRDLGPTHIHGVTGEHVADAPRFEEIASSLLEVLGDRVIVAHNARFDTRFLLAEMARCGHDLREIDSITMCTMQIAREYLPGTARSLADCCRAFDIEIERPHHALSDAVATSQFLVALLRQEPGLAAHADRVRALDIGPWPVGIPRHFAPRPRPMASALSEPNRVVQSVAWVPTPDANAEETEFLAVLDRVIADEFITPRESQELLDAAAHARVTPSRLQQLREMYFTSLVTLAWRDGVLDEQEVRAIETVGSMLSMDESLVSAALKPPAASSPSPSGQGEKSTVVLSPGDLIVFTGEADRPRSHLEALAEKKGLKVWPSVTKKVRIVVAADPTSISGKAAKARHYGIPILSLDEFETLMAS
ncbi:exonuclease domain-containing protein [Microcella daejeonensis]|uniref:exonuclease domain-containing protein n=1 Tax=Microcella daejeonensis TaxID=2994971 RepID=UPI0022704B9B|nr:exonuclease domain-containing protein [Microcella daejeonensis]WAB82914.1 exonuclease domain-containing protein [Microcella daejeonensis]